jgi:hypothetical protein
VLFTFPSRYLFTIGRQRVFSLGEWSPQLPTGFLVSRGTQDTASSPVSFRLHGFHILWPRFPAGSPSLRFGNSTYAVLQPRHASTPVWALPISLAATLGISLISLPPGTEMVHFPGLTRTRLFYSAGRSLSSSERVSPFGNPRINACLRLPEAYRSLPRPSSSVGAKASTVRP